MKIRNLLSILSVALIICGCTFITDPLSISLDDVKTARPTAATMTTSSNVETARKNIKATAAVKEWVIFRDLPDEQCIVIMGLPEFIDTTEIGVFITPTPDGGSFIEVASLSPKAQKLVADELFTILKLL